MPSTAFVSRKSRFLLLSENPCVLLTPLEWLYGKLGRRYPKVFVTLELQAGLFVTAGTVVLLCMYYDAAMSEFWQLLAIAMLLTAGALIWGLHSIYPRLTPISDWIGGERGARATERAWAAAVGLPLSLIRDMLIPILVVVIPSCIAGVVIIGLSWFSFFPLVIAGLASIGYAAILHYLTIEVSMRPILIELNRSASPRIDTEMSALPLRVKLLTALPMINVITGLVVAAIAGAGSLGISVVAAIGVATTISLELTLLLSRSILGPLADLRRATDKLARGDLDATVPVTTADEIGELAASFNQMVEGLRERERIRQAFGTYLDHEVADLILSEGFSERGEEVEVSILFCDVKNFSGFAANAEASEVVARLNALFEVVVPVVAAEGGHVDKFEGDGLMAVFGAPHVFADHADRALCAAIEIDRRVNREGEGGGFKLGIGLNTGLVVAGSIGGGGRLNFSVIGDAVNVAARVEAATRETGDDVLLTEATKERLSESFELDARGARELKGIKRPVRLFAPASERSSGSRAPVEAVRSVYARVRGNRAEG
jgi:adenylate cyclase